MTEEQADKSFGAKDFALLGVILLAGLGLRLYALGFADGNPFLRPDESKVALYALRIASGQIFLDYFWYSHLYFYALAGVFWVVARVQGIALAAGRIDNSVVAQYCAVFFPAGRSMTALFGTCQILLVCRLAQKISSRRLAGLAAALLLALAYLPVREAHFLTVDIAMSFFVLLSFLFLARCLENPDRKNFILSGLALGLAAGTKLNGLTLLPALGLAWLIIFGKEKKPWRGLLLDSRIGLALAMLILAFFLANPSALYYRHSFLAQFHRFREYGLRREFLEPVTEPGIYFYGRGLYYGLGAGALGFAGLGLVPWIKQRQWSGLILFAFALCWLGFHSLSPTRFLRYLDPAIPLICVSAGAGISWLLEKLKARSRIFKYETAWVFALALLALLPGSIELVSFEKLLGRDDTRILAREWITKNLRPGTMAQVGGRRNFRIMLEPELLPGFPSAYFDQKDEPGLLKKDFSDPEKTPDYVITYDSLTPFLRTEKALEEKLGRAGEKLKCFDPYAPGASPSPRYDGQDAFFVPFARFKGIGRPGPAICIYKMIK